MKKFFVTFLLSLVAVSAYCFGTGTYYTIVGKGSSGQTKCSGHVIEDTFFKTIELYVSDMLNQKYYVYEKVQVNENTVKYVCDKENTITYDHLIIFKQKCPNGMNVYFFEFPPLYEGQGRTVYKVVKSE